MLLFPRFEKKGVTDEAEKVLPIVPNPASMKKTYLHAHESACRTEHIQIKRMHTRRMQDWAHPNQAHAHKAHAGLSTSKSSACTQGACRTEHIQIRRMHTRRMHTRRMQNWPRA